MPIISANNLKKTFRVPIKEAGLKGALKHILKPHYESVDVVSNISLHIEKGEAVAYLGPNGAGKSTTIKMLTGILMPTNGEIIINGLHPYKERIENNKQIGVVFGQRTQLWWDLPIMESFSIIKDIYNIPESLYKENLQYFSELLDLKNFLHLPARRLSLGQRMRADIAISFLHNPSIVFLDEPTIGLDLAVKEKVQMFLKTINKERKTTLMLTSHDINDIKNVCERLIIIEKGSVIYDGKFDELINTYLKTKTIHFISNGSRLDASEISIKEFDIMKTDQNKYLVKFNRFDFTTFHMLKVLSEYFDIMDFKVEEPEIECIIKMLYNGDLVL